MGKLKNVLTSGLVFYVLVILIVNFWGDFRGSYDLSDSEENLQDGRTIFEKLSDMSLIQGLNRLQTGVLKITDLGGITDVLGGVAISAIGVLQVLGGVITFPIEIFGIITGFYPGLVPAIIPTMLGLIVVITVAVLLISAKLGFDFT